jgi:DNA-binding IclR family transcriptional regulator
MGNQVVCCSSPNRRTPILRAVDTALRVLAALGSGGGDWSVRELSEHLGIAPSQVYKVLATLSAHGFAEQDPGTRRYRVGWSILLMGMKYVARLDIRRVALPWLGWLVDVTGETSLLNIRRGLHSVCVEKVESPHSVRVTAELGHPGPLYAGGSNKPLIAWLPEDELRDLLGRVSWEIYTDRTPRSPEELQLQLNAIRAQGYAYSAGEVELGIAALGAPVFGPDRRVVASVSITGPSTRLSAERATELAAAVRRAADEISVSLGGESVGTGC